MAATPNVQRIINRLELMWPGQLKFQTYNRRHIGSNPVRPWSQHAGSEPSKGYYGNAVDIFDPEDSYDSPLLDQVHQYLQESRSRLNIRSILWRVSNHHDHIHCDTYPKLSDEWWRRPPPSGPVRTVTDVGEIRDTYDEEDEVPQFTEHQEEQLKNLVLALDHADSTGYGFAKNGVDLIRRERDMPLHKQEDGYLGLTLPFDARISAIPSD